MRRRPAPAPVFVLVLVAVLVPVPVPDALAHDPFEITTDARLHPDRLDLRVTMARSTALRACLGAHFESCARNLHLVTGGGRALEPRTARARFTDEGDVEMALVYPRPALGPVRIEALYLGRLGDATYGATLTVTSAGGDGVPSAMLGQQLLRVDDPAIEVPLPAPGAAPAPPRLPPPRAYLALGVRHILSGYDHLLFLCGLLLACRRLREALLLVTCFTIAHSITLALAALGVVAIPARIVEPLIAATILIVGIENLRRRDQPRARAALAFGFGLVHGLGFAAALRDTGLGANGAPIVGPLLAFNLGVELGQIAVAAPFLALWWRLRRIPAFERYAARVLSVVVAAAGAWWLVARLAGL